MRRIIPFILLLLCSAFYPSQARAQFTAPVFECSTGNSSSTTISCSSSGGSCAPTNALIVAVVNLYQSGGASTATVADTLAYSWTLDDDSSTAANNYRTFYFHTVATSSSCDTFTATLTVAGTFGIIDIYHTTGNDRVHPFDVKAVPSTFTVDANPQVSPSFTTTQPGDFILATAVCAAGSNGWTAGTAYTALHISALNAYMVEYKIAGAAGSDNATAANSQTCVQGTSIGNFTVIAYKTGTVAKYRNHSSVL